MGMPVGAGTDATRVASYNPWVALYWLVSGQDGRRHAAVRRRRTGSIAWRRCGGTRVGSAWFSGEEDKKGAIAPGQLADLAVLSADYFSVPEEEIKGIESVLTLVGGKVVYGRASSPSWPRRRCRSCPTGRRSRAYHVSQAASPAGDVAQLNLCCHPRGLHGLLHRLRKKASPAAAPLWGPGCECFAF